MKKARCLIIAVPVAIEVHVDVALVFT